MTTFKFLHFLVEATTLSPLIEKGFVGSTPTTWDICRLGNLQTWRKEKNYVSAWNCHALSYLWNRDGHKIEIEIKHLQFWGNRKKDLKRLHFLLNWESQAPSNNRSITKIDSWKLVSHFFKWIRFNQITFFISWC